MTAHLPQADVRGKKEEKRKATVKSPKAQGRLRARVQLTDKAFGSDTLLWDGNKND